MDTQGDHYTVEDIGHFVLSLLQDENLNDPLVKVIKQLMGADINHCSPCIKLKKALIEEVKSYDAPFDEERLK